MTKQVNPNIGHIVCFSCGELAAVRKNKSGGLYYDCLECGRLAPNHAGGQRRIQERAEIWGAAGAPAAVPAWIREQWPYSRAIQQRDADEKNGKTPQAEVAGGGDIEAPGASGDVETAAGQASSGDDLPAVPTPPRKRAPKTPRENPKEKPAAPTPTPKHEPGFFEQVMDDI